ncbi:MAG TPA: flagellar hook capping FlgD N-terminal domain-containing protein [Rhizobacter sp.]|nr:flagellar hook capping FlgD N-terminal domain-containing protein [Rhizobacter sp.]
MQTSGTNAATAGATGAASDGAISQALGGSEMSHLFTTLLVAQIRNQNPLEPSDPSQFVAQLTQLSQTEAMQKMVSQSGSQSTSLNSLQSLAIGAQVGSRVMVRADSVQLGSQPIEASVTLSRPANLTAVLTGPDGQEHRIALGSRNVGDVAFTLDPKQLGLPGGRYSLAVQDESGSATPVEVAGELAAVRLMPGGSVLMNVSGVGDIGVDAITRFLGRKA